MMGPIFAGPRVRAIAIEVTKVTTALSMRSMPYQPVFRTMVLVFDMSVLV